LANLSVSENPSRLTVSVEAGGNLTVTNSFSWNGGAIKSPVTLDTFATGTISGSNQRLSTLAADMTVKGSLTLSGVIDDDGVGPHDGELKINDPKVLHVASGATLTSAGTNTITFAACCVTPAKVVNDGTLVVNGGDLEIAAVELDQNGTLDAQSGGRLVTDRAPVAATTGSNYTGAGGWLVSNGAGNVTVLAGTQTLGPNFHLELGGLSVNSGATLAGTATFAGTGTIDWTGGTIAGAFTIGHGIDVNASGVHTDNGRRLLSGASNPSGTPTLTNHGTMVFDQGATVSTTTHAKLVNATDGTITLAPGVVFSSMGCCVDPDQIVNNGSFVVPTGTSADPAELAFIAYKSTGTTTIAAGRELLLDGGATGRQVGAVVNGGGTLTVATPMTVSGTDSVQGNTHVALRYHGSFNGTATLSGSGSLDWTGGNFSGAVTVALGGGTAVSNTGVPANDFKSIVNVNGGSTASKVSFKTGVTFAPGTGAEPNLVNLGSSTLTLAGSTTVGDHVELYAGKLVNTGTLKVQAGTVERTGSSTTVNDGVFTLLAGAKYHAVGDFAQSAAGTLGAHVGSSAHGQLSAQGAVSLKGTLAAVDDGTYNPGVGAKVQIVTSSNVTNSLSCTTTSGAGSGSRHWVASKNANGLALIRKAGAHRHC
jgi:hypothetical protein